MKKRFVVMLSVVPLIIAAAVATASAQADLNTRKALYFTGAKPDSIDLSGDVYAAAGANLNLSAELRTSCDNNICEFNVGVIATKTGGGALSTEIRITTGLGTFSKTFAFGASEVSKQVVLPAKLKLGKNEVTVSIDPNNTSSESNEGNNSFSTTVMVNWKRANPGNKN